MGQSALLARLLPKQHISAQNSGNEDTAVRHIVEIYGRFRAIARALRKWEEIAPR
jgi:hypothetical protein